MSAAGSPVIEKASTAIDVSVLLATRRRPRLLAPTLQSLAAMSTGSLRWELILIDNAGDPETHAVARQAASQLPLRMLVEPTAGKNHALNRGLAEIAGTLVVFTDDDVIVDREWLRELWEGAARWPEASVFGGRVLPRWPAGQREPPMHPFFDHAYAVADFDRPEGRYSSGYVYGPNMAIRAEIFRNGHRFDTAIGPDGTDRYMVGSETSLTVALEKAGLWSVYLPRALVFHQIRPEQLTAKWLYGRAFRKGRSDAVRKGLKVGFAELSRGLLLTLAREYAALWRCRLRGDRRGAFDHGLAYWTARGMRYQCRMAMRRTNG